jgi:RNA polymerase sigma-70 factor (ECF subfamily)
VSGGAAEAAIPESVAASEGELALTPAGSGMETGAVAVDEQTADLLRRAKGGDTEAFAGILVQHERMVLMTAMRLLGRLDAAQDAAQEVFLRLHKYLGRFDEVRSLKPWLYRVVVNVCRDAQRRDRRASLSLESLQEDGWLGETADSTDLEAGALRNEERRIVGEALRRLPEKERAALVLRDVEGLSTREVAEALGSTETTVRSQISRGRLKLKVFVDRRMGART